MSLLVTLLFSIAAVNAQPVAACLNLLTAKSIRHTPTEVHALELDDAGTITRPGEKFPKFPAGHYVYLITKWGETLTSPRYVLPAADGKSLATHKSLLAMYKRVTGVDATNAIVAGGELQTDFTHVLEVKNKSGNFQGSEETLELAVEIFKLGGLPINTTTRLRVMSPADPEDRGHTPRDRAIDEFRVGVLHDVHSSGRGRKILDIYSRLYPLMHETFPGRPGMAAIEDLMGAAMRGAGVTGNVSGFHAFTYPLQEAYTTDGMEYGIWSVEQAENHGGDDSFELGAADQCLNVVIALNSHLEPALRQRWLDLGREFHDLKNIRN